MRVFSIKYKIFVLNFFLTALSLLGFYIISTSIYEKDKVAYIYSNFMSSSKSVRDRLNDNISQSSKYINYIAKNNDRSSLGNDILKSTKVFNKNTKMLTPNLLNLKENSLILYDIQRRNWHIDYKEKLLEMTRGDEKVSTFFLDLDSNTFPIIENEKSGIVALILSKIVKSGQDFSVSTLNYGSKEFLVSYFKVDERNYYIKYVDKSFALSSINVLKNKTFHLFIIVISLSVILSILFAHKVFIPLQLLSRSMKEFGESGKSVKANINTRDEFKEMANIFNSMVSKISELVDKTNRYAHHLEELVQERTANLARALKLQETMLNSLGQGFMMIDKDFNILDRYSKITESFFYSNIAGENFLKVVGLESEENVIFFNRVFEEVLPFEDMIFLAPKELVRDDKRTLSLEFHAVRNESSEIIALVVIISDITKLKLAESEALDEREKSKMILKIARSKDGILRLINQSRSKVESLKAASNEVKKSELFNLLHTLKGGFLTYNVQEITKLLHSKEEEVLALKDEICSHSFVANCLKSVLSVIDQFEKDYSVLLRNDGESNFCDDTDFEVIVNQFKSLEIPAVDSIVYNYLYKKSIVSFLSSFKESVLSYSINVKKRDIHIELRNDEVRVRPDFMNEFLLIFEILAKNSLDHGIESENERRVLKKEAVAKLGLSVRDFGSDIVFFYFDDGKGLDIEKIRSKAIEKGISVKGLSEKEMKKLIFEPDFSTSEEVNYSSGRGYGLNAVDEFVKKHNGLLEVKSFPGKSLFFIFRFCKSIL